MKTADQWMLEFGQTIDPGAKVGMISLPQVSVSILEADDIRDIQLDSYRAGMEAAARIVEAEGYAGSYNHACNALRKIIRDTAKIAQLPQ